MDRDTFWEIIDDARSSTDDADEVAQAVVANLQRVEPEEIISFAQNMYDVLAETYRWDLWAVGYIVNGGCSDDGFEYFRSWLIAQGRERFEAALKTPEIIGEWAEPDENECEDMMGAGYDAYIAKTGAAFPAGAIKRNSTYPPEPMGDPWEEDQLEQLYPSLCAKFS